jgi:23S rRNA (cytosine1962-C5)-methyltransferase
LASHPSLAVKPSRQHPFMARHPWVHASSLIDIDPQLSSGAIVDLTTHDGQWIARGLYNPSSALRVRLYTWGRDQALTAEFFVARVDQAIARRRLAGHDDPETGCRLIYSEADGISGLIVDRYADTLSVQVTAAAIEPFVPAMIDRLVEVYSPRAVVLRTDVKLQSVENFQTEQGLIRGHLDEDAMVSYRQNGLQMEVDLLRGQKTGGYLDQRGNHAAAAAYAAGRQVLDICCHTGGFGLVAAARGATAVLGVDSSEPALEGARRNAERNAIENITFQAGDCFDTLTAMAKEQRKFDMVILDPPRMAGTRKHVESAMRAYYRLNRSAIELLPAGGILVTCSCSGRVTRSDFLNNLVDVGRRAARDIIVLENRGATSDHPMRVSCPESDYLKCLICEIQ